MITDRDYLRTRQYRTDANLAARQSIYRFQRPRVDLPAAVLGLAGLTGMEAIADVGCGNGVYLAALARRGHAGAAIGVDLSPGMLRAARAAAGQARLVVGDAAALPIRDGAADVTLAATMLHHVPDRQAAARELRRVTRDGGQVLAVLNGTGHLAELCDLVTRAAADIGLADVVWAASEGLTGGLSLDEGEELLGGVFGSVQRHDFRAELELPRPEPVLEYIASMRSTQGVDDPQRLVDAASRHIRPAPDGVVRIRTWTGCLVCR